MSGHRFRRSTVLLAALATVSGVAFATMFAFAATRLGEHGAGPQAFRPTGIPANVSTAMADAMQLSPVPPRKAPGFTLTDQDGRQVSLASLHGREVVAVNVNPYHRQVSAVAAFSREQEQASVRTWHFVTGSLASLRAVWSAYQIEVDAPNPNADVIHTSLVYFIGPSGHERYVVAPMDDHTKKGVAYLPAGQLTSWAGGIALIARDVLGVLGAKTG